MNRAARATGRSPDSIRRRPRYWLIARDGHGWTEVLTRELSSGESVLPVFSSEEDAGAFIRPGADGGWRAKKTGTRELVSLLSGPCRDVKHVALDPWPKIMAETTISLVSVDRESFVAAGSKRRA
jgi:hypothetical protein